MIVTQDEATGRYRFKINEMIDGKRVRKTKLLPAGFSMAQAYKYAELLYSGPLSFQDQLAINIVDHPEQPGTVYFIQNQSLPALVKIGMTRRSVYERIKAMSTGHAYPWKIICHGLMKHPDIVEETLHHYLSNYRECHNREFFRMTAEAANEALDVCMEVDGTDLSAIINTIGRR